jgi:hypothetical protein
MNAKPFFDWMDAREAIYLKRTQGLPPPWSDDPILRHYKFTNVDRELDATTVWFAANVRDPVADEPVDVLRCTVIFRLFNRISTGELLLRADLFDDGWDENWDSGTHAKSFGTISPGSPGRTLSILSLG